MFAGFGKRRKMSRIGQQPVELKTAKVDFRDDLVQISGSKGSLSHLLPGLITATQKDGLLVVARKNNSRQARALHGLTRSILANMVHGVTEGWEKTLEIQGIGYRVEKKGETLVFSLGLSHQVTVEPIEGISFEIKDKNIIVISGADKVAVGNVAAKIRKIRPPDAYKGKGIRYQGEVVHLKAGKAGKVGSAGGAA